MSAWHKFSVASASGSFRSWQPNCSFISCTFFVNAKHSSRLHHYFTLFLTIFSKQPSKQRWYNLPLKLKPVEGVWLEARAEGGTNASPKRAARRVDEVNLVHQHKSVTHAVLGAWFPPKCSSLRSCSPRQSSTSASASAPGLLGFSSDPIMHIPNWECFALRCAQLEHWLP